ncbi:hypothetical protein BSLG_004035 [Batrachochytrium salamandrivorans]|nr:hypothetical protein BSLG_004035 [Batrachochytrium salamandrivorans]
MRDLRHPALCSVFGPDGAYSDDSPENTISSVLGLVAVTENGLMPVQNFRLASHQCTDGTDSAPAPQDAPSGTVVVYERLQFRSTAISTTRRRLGKQFT